MDPKEQPSMLPVPQLVVRVGVTGHRPHKLPLPESQDELKAKIREVLENIQHITQRAFTKGHSAGSDAYSGGGPELRLISSLAEGADRLVAEEALLPQLGFSLQCPLPFEREEYAKDFETPESRDTFYRLLANATAILELDGRCDRKEDGSRMEGEVSYEAAGRVMLSQCDVLIAIWNGEPGKRGGTEQMIREAHQAQIPVLWIHPKIGVETCLLEPSSKPWKENIQTDISLLAKRLDPILYAPGRKEIGLRNRFLGERQPSLTWGLFFKTFCDAWRDPHQLAAKDVLEEYVHVKNFEAVAQTKWNEIWREFPQAKSGVRQQLEEKYLKTFAWSDGLAEIYAEKYRSSFIITYLMGALAILFAFLGSAEGGEHILGLAKLLAADSKDWIKYVPLWLELALISSILYITLRGRQQDWHGRWMDYRVLAESMRQMQFLAPLGRVTSNFRVPSHLGPSDPRRKWFNFHFRSLVRGAGMISARIDKAYLVDYHKVITAWTASQIDYHRNKGHHFHSISKNLHRTTQCLFVLTAILCVLHILPHLFHFHFIDSIEFLLTMGVIVLPAFAGALGAILHLGEFERIALRSRALKNRLTSISKELASLEGRATSRDLSYLAQTLSETALDELVDWRFVFLDKNLSLPA